MADGGEEGRGPRFWRVLNGFGSRVVREGCKLGSPECPEKLEPGAVVQELALEGDRLHYWLQSGTGPTNGWVTLKVRGQDLLVPSSPARSGPPPEVWIATMGTRGDLQPFVVLGLALQEAGFIVRLFGPPELRTFTSVADGTLNYTEVCGGWGGHTILQEPEGLQGTAEDEAEASQAPEPPPPQPPEAPPGELSNLALCRPVRASSSKSAERAAAFAVDGRPETRWTSVYEDGQWLAVDLGEVCSLQRVEVRWEAAFAESYLLEGSFDGESWATLAEESGREGWVSTTLPSGSSARWVRVYGRTRGLPGFGFSIYELLVHGWRASEGEAAEGDAQAWEGEAPAREGEVSAQEGEVSASPDPQAQAEYDAPAGVDEQQPQQQWQQQQRGRDRFLHFLGMVGVDTNNSGDVEHMVWLWQEMPKAILALQAEFEAGKPDVLLYNHLMINVGLFAWKSFGVRSVFVNLGLEFYFAPQAKDVFNYRTLSAFDSYVMHPIVDVQTISAMSPAEFNGLYTSSDRILGTTRLLRSVMPVREKDKDLASKWDFTGFWILEEERQMEDPSAFGGPELLRQLRAFVEAGRPPVYLGWGSMPVGPRVLAIAVAGLRHLGLRAVFVRGWGFLSRDMLDGGIYEMGLEAERSELNAYADANTLFIDKAPHEWLFPRCCCTVHHGGAGTTAAALRAGVPTIIVPLGYDQTYHGEWVESLGVGVKCSTVMEVQELEFREALRRATSEPEMAERSREVAATLRQEPGVAGAVAQIRRIVYEDVRPGKAKVRWQVNSLEWRKREEKQAQLRAKVARSAEERRASAGAG